MPQITAELTDEELKILTDLAARRGVDANAVLKQAIATEKLISENVGLHDDLLIKKSDNTLAKVIFSGAA